MTPEQREARAKQVAESLEKINNGLEFADIWFSDKAKKIRRRWPDGTIIDAKAQTITVPGVGWSTFDEWWEGELEKKRNQGFRA